MTPKSRAVKVKADAQTVERVARALWNTLNGWEWGYAVVYGSDKHCFKLARAAIAAINRKPNKRKTK